MKTSPVSFFFVRLSAALFALSAGLAVPSALAADEDQPATKADIMRLDGRISDLSNRMSRLEGALESTNERLARLEGINELLVTKATVLFLFLTGLTLAALAVNLHFRMREPATAS